MRTGVVMLAAAVTIGTSGCAATTRTTTRTTTLPALTFPVLASATATFVSKDGGRGADSPLTVHVLRSHTELGAELRLEAVKFDGNSSSGALTFVLAEPPFTTNDIHDGQLRLRLVPDHDDDWTFDLHITMRFSDGTARDFMWRGIRLDHTSPERVLMLGPART